MKVTGKVYANATSKLNEDLLLNLIILGKDSNKKMSFLPVDKNGIFQDKSAFFYDTSRIYYSINGKSKNNSYVVHFENGLLNQSLKKLNLGAALSGMK